MIKNSRGEGKIQWIINRVFASTILLIVLLFIIPPVFGIADGDKVSFYEYLYGWPLRWLNVVSVTDKKSSFVGTFFTENEGVKIQWLNLLGSFLLIIVVVSIIFFFVKKFHRKERVKIKKTFYEHFFLFKLLY
ncbi:hypothetical protein [Listeria innocua]|uniref:hypothetical protein n=1 Tax=Listeria innocua TaxID=1642 RepID=UPI00162A9BB1|nr:hypothetical protein [Listeria innocua]MBC2137574.1 hypothetical protein [Listeria innocua]MBC2140583.1 hypothetical protein [Listeria innocua]